MPRWQYVIRMKYIARLSALVLAFSIGIGAASQVINGDMLRHAGGEVLAFLEDVVSHPVEFMYAIWVTIVDTDGEG